MPQKQTHQLNSCHLTLGPINPGAPVTCLGSSPAQVPGFGFESNPSGPTSSVAAPRTSGSVDSMAGRDSNNRGEEVETLSITGREFEILE